MKILRLLFLLIVLSSVANAQVVSRGHGGTGPWVLSDSGKFIMSNGTLKPSWQNAGVIATPVSIANGGTGDSTASGALVKLLPDTTGFSGNSFSVLAGGGFGWAAGGSGTFENWSATDAGSPVQAPSVTVGTKGLAMLDSAVASGYSSIAIGNGSKASQLGSIAISNGLNLGAGQVIVDSGKFGILISSGAYSLVGSYATVGIGYGVYDGCTEQRGALFGGWNTLIGGLANCDNHPFNTCVGYSTTANGRSNLVLGDGCTSNGNSNICIGANAGGNNTGNSQINMWSVDLIDNGNTSAVDSTTIINGDHLTARNKREYLFGTKNKTGTTYLFQFSAGGISGNASTFDVLSGSFDGTVTAGKNFASTLRTITNANDAGTQGEICYDADFIYICTATNTWKRVAIATW